MLFTPSSAVLPWPQALPYRPSGGTGQLWLPGFSGMRCPAQRGECIAPLHDGVRDADSNLLLARRLSTVSQILIYLPLTLSTLSKSAFLLLSFLLFLHSLIHGTLVLFWGSPALSILQVPMHPFLLLVCFNVFSESVSPWLTTTASWWGTFLQWSSPGFIVLEGMSSLLVAQRLGQVGKELVDEGEGYQFGLLVGAAAAYVASAWWIVVVSAFSSGVPLRRVLTVFVSPSLILRRRTPHSPRRCSVSR